MNQLLLFALLVYIVSAESCIIQDKKGKPDVRIIELDDSSKESSESEVVALDLPDKRRKEDNSQRKNNFCENDDDCGPGLICLAYLICVRETWLTVESLEANAANSKLDAAVKR